MPSISAAMLAQDILDYFQQHGAAFEKFVLDRHGFTEGTVDWEAGNKVIVVKLRSLAQDDGVTSEREFAIRIEKVHPA